MSVFLLQIHFLLQRVLLQKSELIIGQQTFQIKSKTEMLSA